MRAIAVRCFSARPARPAAGRKFPRTFVSCIGASPAAMARCRILKRDFSMTLTVDREWPARILLAVGQLAANGAPSPRNARVGFHDDLVYCSATHSAVLSDKAVKVALYRPKLIRRMAASDGKQYSFFFRKYSSSWVGAQLPGGGESAIAGTPGREAQTAMPSFPSRRM